MDNQVFLFPLTNSILFKKVTLPYHIFEPRYRQMIRDALENQVPVGVIPHHPSGLYRGEICIAGVPRILSTYPDGRMDVSITGTLKCKLTQAQADLPYKVYAYQELKEKSLEDDSHSMELESFKNMLKKWADNFLSDSVQRHAFSRTLEDPELLINYCAIFLVDDFMVKKEVMQADALVEKINILMKIIGPKEVSLGPFMPALKF
jgi:Lon protease-like protein